MKATTGDASKLSEHARGAGAKSSGHVYVCLLAGLVTLKGTPERKSLEQFFEARGFFADRIETPAALAFKAVKQQTGKQKAKASLEKRGKLLKYDRVSPDLQKLLDKSRIKEWNNYLSFGATKLIKVEEANRLIDELGAEELPTQWIERDKNEFKRIKDADIPPEMKSRLVARQARHILVRTQPRTARHRRQRGRALRTALVV